MPGAVRPLVSVTYTAGPPDRRVVAVGPSASSTTVFRMPERLIVADPASDSSGNVMPCRLLKSARIAGES